MAKMTTAVRANDLCPLHAKCAICMSRHRAGNCVEESWPSASALELRIGCVQWRLAGGTGVYTLLRVMLIVFAAVGRFGALLSDDAELLYRTC